MNIETSFGHVEIYSKIDYFLTFESAVFYKFKNNLVRILDFFCKYNLHKLNYVTRKFSI
jgi:hypothetical protein